MAYGDGAGDNALAPLEEMHGLLCLDLAYSPIGDAAVPHIAKISGLTALSLRETNVGDESLPYLKKMKKLVRLRIGDTRLSLQAVDALRGAAENQRRGEFRKVNGLRTSRVIDFGMDLGAAIKWRRSGQEGVVAAVDFFLPIP